VRRVIHFEPVGVRLGRTPDPNNHHAWGLWTSHISSDWTQGQVVGGLLRPFNQEMNDGRLESWAASHPRCGDGSAR
jgi:hypothetical protein